MSRVVSGTTATQCAAEDLLPALATPPNRPGPLRISTRAPRCQPRPRGSLLIEHGLNSDKMNADKLFNLLCLHGNVGKIKFLKNKNGCAMVKMEDHLGKERAVGHQNNTDLFDCRMQLGY
ncbi:hypothetical protein HPB47_002196 [Ixodes persulcatus]|uniref:Uncharacterized protein n=1 Tax=Ixodes persulcatus TaxID=34615 RepID=A0AC60PM66_IXOPE|nr:hypothetical protein HPB47_002196 [Ixodes persulcatus]